MKKQLATLGSLLLLVSGLWAQAQPNVIVIFADDMGYADASSFGASQIQTPNIDQMGTNGVTLTDFYVPHPICTPSRAALLTGRYAWRTGSQRVIFPGQNGLDGNEVTIAEVLKRAGYSTACIGKWHLGDKPGDLPRTQGFDYYYGIPYSNDMDMGAQIALADDIVMREGITLEELQNGDYNHPRDGGDFPPLMRNEEAIEFPADQSTLTKRYTEEALSYVESAHTNGEPFFLYMPHTFPHVPLFTSADFTGVSAGGEYGDVIEEMDWSVGEILQKLDDLGISNNTLVIFTSDNGPWLSKGDQAGSAEPLRGGKFTLFDGGTRVPFVAQWPGQIPVGTLSNEPAMTIDLLPTIAQLADATDFLPDDRVIDGRNIWNLLTGNGARSWSQLYYSQNNQNNLQAIRKGVYKAHFNNSTTTVEQLYDLSQDIDENNNLVNSQAAVAAELLADAQAFKRQSEVALAGVMPYNYYGQSSGGVQLVLLGANQAYLKDAPNATISTVPQEFSGSVLFQYANNDQAYDGASFIVGSTLFAGEAIVAYDAAATVLPTWLDDWVNSGETITVNYNGQPAPLNVYKKSLAAGELFVFGGNAADGADASVPYLAALDVPTDGLDPIVQEPYNASPHAIPGQIEIEEYDLGGQGVAYNDVNPAQQGNASFRLNEGVDISNALNDQGGFNLAFTEPGEWIEYTVEVSTTGLYDLEARVASPFSGTSFSVEFNGVDVTGMVSVPNTGDYQNWQSVLVKDIPLQAGTQIMRFVSNTDQYNVNYLSFSATTAEPTQEGEVLYRVNAGAGELVATDSPSPNWEADTGDMPSTYVNAVATGNKTNSTNAAITRDASVPDYVPEALFQSERFSDATTPVAPIEWKFPISTPSQIEVILYFAEIFREDDMRFFDVFVEGLQELDDYSIHAEVGPNVAVAKSFTVEVTDAALNIDLLPEGLLPKISGIEVIFRGVAGDVMDNVPPVITISGDNPTSVELGTSYTDAGATAIDNVDGTVPVTIESNNVDINTVGTYTVEYAATDAAGNTATATRTVEVIDVSSYSIDQVLYRVNAGGVALPATDTPEPDWSTDLGADPSVYLDLTLPTETSQFAESTITRDPVLPSYVPTELFQSERFSSNDFATVEPMHWNFPITQEARIEVRLYLAENFRNDAMRFFDLEIEDQQVLDDFNIWVEVGSNYAIMRNFLVNVIDGNLDLDFIPQGLLPKVNGIELIYRGEPVTSDDTPPVITINGDNPVSVIVGNTYVDPGASANDDVDATVEVQATGTVDANTVGSYTITYTATDMAGNTATAERLVHVQEAEAFDPTAILFRVNAGGEALTAFQSGAAAWILDTDANPSPFVNAVESGERTSTFTDPIVLDPSVPAYVPLDLFSSERFSSNTIVPTPPLRWTFPLPDPTRVEVRLYFAENFREDNMRIFDATIEDIPVLEDYIIHADVGSNVGVMKSFIANVTDGNLNIDLLPVGLLPKLNGIEVIDRGDLDTGNDLATLNGTVNLQGRSDNSSTISVEIYEPGTANLVQSFAAVEVDPGGNFTLSDLPEGNYDVYVKGATYLATQQTVNLSTGANTADFGLQLAGDLDGNNAVNLLDFSILSDSFNLVASDTDFDARADLDGNEAVNLQDFSILASNFNASGAQPPQS